MADDDGNTPPSPPADPPPDESEKWKTLSRKHEKAAKDATKRLGELETELEQLKGKSGDHQDAIAKAQADIASARLAARLAHAGITEETASGLLAVIDPAKLLKDGAPSDEQIKAVAEAISKNVPKTSPPPPDPDQGKGDQGGTTKPSLNDLFRAASGRS